MYKNIRFLIMSLVLSTSAMAGSYSYSPVELNISNDRNCDMNIRWHHGENAKIEAPNGWDISPGSTGHFVVQQTGGSDRSNFQVTFVATCLGDPKEIASIRVENEARGTAENLDTLESFTITRATNLVSWWPTSAVKSLQFNNDQICSAAWKNSKGMCSASRHEVVIGN